MSLFKRATKDQIKLRLALTGPSGSGKSYSALAIASHLGSRVAVVDTEHSSANRYADLFDFETCQLTNFHPHNYIQAIKAAEGCGFDLLIIDSFSHAWQGRGGILEIVENSKSSFSAWKDVRPLERALIETILSSPMHIIVTMRTKTEWVMEEYTKKNGEKGTNPKKVGTSPIQSQGIDYEFDIVGEMNHQHVMTITKTRCSQLTNESFPNPGKEFASTLSVWLSSGAPALETAVANVPTTPPDSDNPNRELLKRIGQITGHNSKQIAAILEANFPGFSSNQLGSLEVKSVVDAMCVDAAVLCGMNQAQAQSTFSSWLGLQNQEISNSELARLWMSQIEVPAF